MADLKAMEAALDDPAYQHAEHVMMPRGTLREMIEELKGLRLVHLESRELLGEADARGKVPIANLEALRALLWRVSVKASNGGRR